MRDAKSAAFSFFFRLWFVEIALLNHNHVARRPQDIRISFERFGPVKDVYLPKNYHTGYVQIMTFILQRSIFLRFLIFKDEFHSWKHAMES